MPLESLRCSLDVSLMESSGLLPWKPGVWITINDGGGKAELYFFSEENGKILGTLKLDGAKNVDWEELAVDEKGNIYVGDIGNNLNRRRDQSIYLIRKEEVKMGERVKPEQIKVRFEDQMSFPPSRSKWHYDIEAMVVLNDSIHLFTKNRGTPFNGFTYRYVLPAKVGEWEAKKVDSLYLGQDGIREEFWVSSSTYDFETQTLALLSYQRLFILPNWRGGSLSNEGMEAYRFGVLRQREALVLSRGRWFLTEEGGGDHRAHLYELDLDPDSLYLLSNIVEGELILKGFTSKSDRIGFEIFDQLGKRLMYGLGPDTVHGRILKRFDLSEKIPKGQFVLFVRCGKMKQAFRFEKTTHQSKAKLMPAEEGKK